MNKIFKTAFLLWVGILCLKVGKLHAEEPDAVCGNGKLEAYEQCDDGNLADHDGCDHLCQIQSKNSFTQNNMNVLYVQCGNAKLESSEACDDGNLTDGDGCDHFCQKEVLHMTPVTMNHYQLGCGNGDLAAGEECDDGNGVDGDGCSASCKKEMTLIFPMDAVCGDSVIEKGESCDDGNRTDGDGCDKDCKVEATAPVATSPTDGGSVPDPVIAAENPKAPQINSVEDSGVLASIAAVSQSTGNAANEAGKGSGCSLIVNSGETSPGLALLTLGGFLLGLFLTKIRNPKTEA